MLAPEDKAAGTVRDEGAMQLSKYLEAALEAIKSKYLKSLVTFSFSPVIFLPRSHHHPLSLPLYPP